MPHDHNKKCLDNSSVVDTSSIASLGRRAFAAWPGTAHDRQSPWRAVIVWSS